MLDLGGILVLDLAGQAPQLGVVLSVNQRDIRVRKQNGGEVSLALGQCIPITPSDNMLGTRQGESFTHFISMEFKQDETFKAFQKKVLELQERMSEVDGVGKPSKPESLHLTMATLHAGAEEVAGLMEKTELVFKKYIDLMDSPCGLSTTFKGVLTVIKGWSGSKCH